MADSDVDIDVDTVEEIVETGSIRKTVRKSYIIQEVSILLLLFSYCEYHLIINCHKCKTEQKKPTLLSIIDKNFHCQAKKTSQI